MQALVRVIGRFLAFCMGTTPAESINAAANIFVSMVCVSFFSPFSNAKRTVVRTVGRFLAFYMAIILVT